MWLRVDMELNCVIQVDIDIRNAYMHHCGVNISRRGLFYGVVFVRMLMYCNVVLAYGLWLIALRWSLVCAFVGLSVPFM